jgi:hypothetical protein
MAGMKNTLAYRTALLILALQSFIVQVQEQSTAIGPGPIVTKLFMAVIY